MIMGPLFFVIGVALLFFASSRIWFFWQSRRWPCVTGVITRSEVRDVADDSGDLSEPCLEYSFEVAGRTFTGSARRFGFNGDLSRFREDAKARVVRFPMGAAVSVWHHPKQPSIAVLERKLEPAMFGCLLFGMVVTVFAGKAIYEAIVL